jgi:hypothetical protein
VGLLACAVIVSACGGSRSPEKAERSRLVARANAICRSAITASSDLDQSLASLAQVVAFVKEAEPIFNRLVSELKRLNPPPNMRREYQSLVSTAQASTVALSKLPEAISRKNEREALTALTTLKSNKFAEEAKMLGIEECAGSATPH